MSKSSFEDFMLVLTNLSPTAMYTQRLKKYITTVKHVAIWKLE